MGWRYFAIHDGGWGRKLIGAERAFDKLQAKFNAQRQGIFIDDEAGVVVAAGDAFGFVAAAKPEVAPGPFAQEVSHIIAAHAGRAVDVRGAKEAAGGFNHEVGDCLVVDEGRARGGVFERRGRTEGGANTRDNILAASDEEIADAVVVRADGAFKGGGLGDDVPAEAGVDGADGEYRVV